MLDEFLACLPAGVDAASARQVGQSLLARWDEPHRRYHDRAHLRRMLNVLGPAVPADLRLAAWYHDAVYDPRAIDNEERSAALAAAQLPALGVHPAEVARLVLLTRDHAPDPADRAGVLLCDADLAILAAPEPEYAAYTAAIRAEYSFVPDPAFRTGRAAVLRRLLALPTLFHTHPSWEPQARANLTHELHTLTP